MGTFKISALAILAGYSFASTVTAGRVQGGPPPIKLIGPSILTTSSKKMAATQDASYTYEVDLESVRATDTVVTIDDITDSAQPTQYQVTIPAGHIGATFEVIAAYPGEDVITARTSYMTTYMEVLVI